MSIGPSGSTRIGSGDGNEKQSETNDEEHQTDQVELPECPFQFSFGTGGEWFLSSRGLGGFDFGSEDAVGSGTPPHDGHDG